MSLSPQDELTLLPSYITPDSPPRMYLKGWSFRVQVYREFVEVYPEDIMDADPVQHFFVGNLHE